MTRQRAIENRGKAGGFCKKMIFYFLRSKCEGVSNPGIAGRYNSALLLPGSKPFKGAQKTRLKSTSFQERQDWTHLTLDLGKSICGVFRARDPIRNELLQ